MGMGGVPVRDVVVVGEHHLKLALRLDGRPVDAIFFRREQPLPPRPTLVYRPEVNEFNGMASVQLVVEHCVDG